MAFHCFAFRFCRVSIFHIKFAFSSIQISEGGREFIAEKIKDEDYYLLTLVAIAKELKDAELTEANIVLAAGLPLTWTSGQKKEFAAYLGKNKEVDFNYEKLTLAKSWSGKTDLTGIFASMAIRINLFTANWKENADLLRKLW